MPDKIPTKHGNLLIVEDCSFCDHLLGERAMQALCEGAAAISHADFSAGHSPLLNNFVVGAIGLQLLKGCFYSVEHRGVALANNNTLFRGVNDGTTNHKLAWMLLVVVVGDRRVLV